MRSSSSRWLASVNSHGGMKEETTGGTPARLEGEATVTSESSVLLGEEAALESWRCYLFGVPEGEAERAEQIAKGDLAEVWRQRVPREEKALEVLQQGGLLSQAEYLRCRVRYFTDGVVLGGKAFVESMFQAARDRFAPGRRDGARPLRGLELGKKPDRLYNMRQLQRDVFG